MTNEIVSQLIEASTESFDLYQSGLGETTVLFCNPHTLVTLTIQECLKLIQEEKQEIENMKVFSTEDKAWNKARVLQCDRLINRINELLSKIHATDDRM
jgi:hypothetical protein